MNNQVKSNKKQNYIRSLVIPDAVYNKAKLVAHFMQRSVSSLIRELINESFRKNKQNIELTKQEVNDMT